MGLFAVLVLSDLMVFEIDHSEADDRFLHLGGDGLPDGAEVTQERLVVFAGPLGVPGTEVLADQGDIHMVLFFIDLEFEIKNGEGIGVVGVFAFEFGFHSLVAGAIGLARSDQGESREDESGENQGRDASALKKFGRGHDGVPPCPKF